MAKHTQLKSETAIKDKDRKTIVQLLQKAYNMELETVVNYLANSVFLDGMLAMEVKESLQEDVTAELGHAQRLAKRIKVLGGDIPGSQALEMNQTSLQPPKDSLDVEAVIRGVIDAEEGAIDHYQKIIKFTGEDRDPVTQDLAIELKGDEEEHRREFVGFLREWKSFDFPRRKK